MTGPAAYDSAEQERGRDRLTRWRLVLGGEQADGIGEAATLDADDVKRDEALRELYDGERRSGLGASAPRVARWLGDIRGYFPSSVVQVMQHDAMDRLGLTQLLLEPELMEAVQPDVGLVATLVGLGRVIPERSRATARAVVRVVTDELEARLRAETVQAVHGALNRAARTRRPRASDIDWNRTIAANLKHYQPEHGTVVPERLVGHARRAQRVERRIILCIDQSGSMAESVVYSSVFGAVLASLRSVDTRLVAFDTAVVDLTDELDDPVDVLFGVQLGGGTDINRALAYCEGLIEQPGETILVLISDLYEGGIAEEMVRRAASIVGSGATMVALLALSDSGRPSFDADHAAALAAVGVPAFACTPDRFPDLMATAIEKRDITAWAAAHDIVTTHESEPPT
ncbi:vWA domain-containing protein [Humibacillus xanthopallidus]|uniref:VWA domain containing CoxE-like protein n=1 Tax=Humibacillus xanthopallidus TaxID=412689 RepID=A0A543I319_9MICO|nr:VWA domain-containing protein [Humibacillus xanthopallidus]TQM64988.1 VWA domain containing CoxE-like protein [Humibacillus xanthopallidus]